MQTIKKLVLKYISEIFIIVIGVSISIWMSEWQNDREKAHKGRELLKEIHTNLVLDSTNFNSHIKAIDQQIKWGIPLVVQDSLAGRMDSVLFFVSAVPNYVPFEATTVGYTHLHGSGGFELIKDKELLKEIIQVYSSDYEKLEMYSDGLNKYIHEQIIPFYNKNMPLFMSLELEALGEQLEPFKATLKSQEYRNMVRIHVNIMGQYVTAYKSTLEKMGPLLEKIEKEIRED